MKKIGSLLLAFVLAVGLCACAAMPTVPDDSKAYSAVLSQYHTALAEQWDAATLVDAELCYLVTDCHNGAPLDDIGYAVVDIDGNGKTELVIGSLVDDPFFGKMVFDLLTLDENGAPVRLYQSAERDRLYYAGENRFADVGSSGWNSSVDITFELTDGVMHNTGKPTPESDYVQLTLTPFSALEK